MDSSETTSASDRTAAPVSAPRWRARLNNVKTATRLYRVNHQTRAEQRLTTETNRWSSHNCVSSVHLRLISASRMSRPHCSPHWQVLSTLCLICLQFLMYSDPVYVSAKVRQFLQAIHTILHCESNKNTHANYSA